MVSFAFSVITLGLAALSSAAPAPVSISKTCFTLRLAEASDSKFNGMTLVAQQDSETIGVYNLIFERPQVTGTPAYLNSTGGYLDFNITTPNQPKDTPYAMDFESVGDNYGYSTPVTAVYGVNDGGASPDLRTKGFSFSDNGYLVPPMTAALQSFYICNSTLQNGHEEQALRFGVANADGSNPEGCGAAIRLARENNVASSQCEEPGF